MVLKYSFKLFFLKCIFEFIINTAPEGSNTVNGRGKYFNTNNFKNGTAFEWPSGMWPHVFAGGG